MLKAVRRWKVLLTCYSIQNDRNDSARFHFNEFKVFFTIKWFDIYGYSWILVCPCKVWINYFIFSSFRGTVYCKQPFHWMNGNLAMEQDPFLCILNLSLFSMEILYFQAVEIQGRRRLNNEQIYCKLLHTKCWKLFAPRSQAKSLFYNDRV